MDFHRADTVHHNRHTQADEYEKNRDTLLGLFVPSTNTHAIRVVLGSHLWSDEKPDFDSGENVLVDIEMEKGEALIMLGSVYYSIDKVVGTSVNDQAEENESENDVIYVTFSCPGIYKPPQHEPCA